MKTVGYAIPATYAPHTRWVRDLQAFDGPLLSEHVNVAGERLLLRWCDQDDVASRWLAFRVRERDVLRLLARQVGVRALVTEELPDGVVMVLDYGSDGEVVHTAILTPDEVPDEYLPRGEGLLDPELMGALGSGCVGVLDGKWSADGIATLWHYVRDAHAFIYTATTAPSRKFRSAPFKGGFSTVNMYTSLASFIPSTARANAEKVVYSSPGFVTFTGDLNAHRALRTTMDAVGEHSTRLHEKDRALSAFLRESRMNDRTEPPTPDEEEMLCRLGRDLLEGIGFPSWDWLLGASPSVFQAAKVARGHYNRLRKLKTFEQEGRCKLALTGPSAR